MGNTQRTSTQSNSFLLPKPQLETRLILVIILLIIGVEVFHFLFLTTRPPVFLDEPWNSNKAWVWLTTGVPFDSMHTGTMDRFGYGWLRHPYLGTLPWVASFALFGLGIFQARLVSYLFGLLLLVGFYFTGRQLYNRLTGALAALLLSLSHPFLLSSHWARQDIMVAGAVVTALGLAVYAFKKERWWAHLTAGLLLGCSLDIHQNGGLFIPGIALVYLYQYRSQIFKQRGTWLVAAGGLAGIVYYFAAHVLPAPDIYLAYNAFEFANRHAIPITNPTPLNLLRSLDSVIGLFHFYENGLEFALVGVGFLYLVFKRRPADRQLLIYTLSAVLFFTLLQGANPDQYAIELYPFFILPVAVLFTDWRQIMAKTGEQRLLVTALLGMFVLNGVIHLVRPMIEYRDYDYNQLVAEVAAAAPGEGKVMGDPLWWFGFSDRNYSSTMNLIYSHYYDGITYSEALAAARPDYLIIDNHDNSIWLQWELQDVIQARGTRLFEIFTIDYGQVTVYGMDWDAQEN